MHSLLYICLAILMGAVLSVYLPMNSSMAKYLGSSIMSNVIFYLVAFVTSIFICIVVGDYETIHKVKTVPITLYLAGVMSGFNIWGTTFLIPNLGSRKFFILLIAGQVLMAVLISHFGVLESPKDPVNMKKIIGAVLVIAGAAISMMN